MIALHKLRSNRGMTLVEIIVAVAILSIIVIGILSMYRFASTQIYTAGSRSDKILDARAIADDLIDENETQRFSSISQIDLYLTGKGYHGVTVLSDISTKYDDSDVNYYISTETYKAGVAGYEVTILVFINNKASAQLTTFVIKGGGIS